MRRPEKPPVPRVLPRAQKREQFWRITLGRFAESGLDIRGFCRRHRLPETAFYFWRREIAARDRERAAWSRPRSPAPSPAPNPAGPPHRPYARRSSPSAPDRIGPWKWSSGPATPSASRRRTTRPTSAPW